MPTLPALPPRNSRNTQREALVARNFSKSAMEVCDWWCPKIDMCRMRHSTSSRACGRRTQVDGRHHHRQITSNRTTKLLLEAVELVEAADTVWVSRSPLLLGIPSANGYLANTNTRRVVRQK